MSAHLKPFDHDELLKLDGDVPILRSVPYGIQHILAMFVANLAPIMIIAGVAGLGDAETGGMIQSAMLIAGIGTLIQLFPIGRLGSGLPIVMGISFTFVTVMTGVVATYGMGAAAGAIIVGGCIEGVLGLFAQYWRRIITPIVAAVVVTSIGFSLLSVGARRLAAAAVRPISAACVTWRWVPSRWWRAWRSSAWSRASKSICRCCLAW